MSTPNDAIEVAPPSEKEVARAEVEKALVAREVWRRGIDALGIIEAAEESVYDEPGADAASPILLATYAHQRTHAAADEARRLILEAHPEPTGELAAYAVDTILAAEDELERAQRFAETLLARADRKVALARHALWPVLERYAEKATRTSKKGWRLPGTEARLQLCAAKGKLEVQDRTAVLGYVKEKIGAAEAIEREILRVREEVSEAKLRDWLESVPEGDPKPAVPGITYRPPGDELRIYRR